MQKLDVIGKNYHPNNLKGYYSKNPGIFEWHEEREQLADQIRQSVRYDIEQREGWSQFGYCPPAGEYIPNTFNPAIPKPYVKEYSI